jgi:hypothetical protein
MLIGPQVANISDRGYLGITQTATCMSHLLQSPTENNHATLLMLFMNAVEEEVSKETSREGIKNRESEIECVIQYKSFTTASLLGLLGHGSESVLMASSLPLVRDLDKYFSK